MVKMKIKLVIICCFVLSVACCSSKANKGNAMSSSEELVQTTGGDRGTVPRHITEIVVFTEDGIVGLDKTNPSVVINKNPFGR